MALPPPTLEYAKAVIAAVEDDMRRGKTRHAAIADVARELSIPRNTLISQLAPNGIIERVHGLKLGQIAPVVAEQAEPEITPERERRETHDASFWKKVATQHKRELSAAEHLAEELAGIRNAPIQIPEWVAPSAIGPRRRAVVGCLLTDVHAGEVIDAEEILGLNEFNLDICRARLRRYFQGSCEVGSRWVADCEPVGAFLALGGDLISGDIHEELRATNALTSLEQVWLVVEEVTAGIRALKEAFGRVHVASVPGNHGRQTIKPSAKLAARMSYDTLVARMLADRFAADPDVTFQITHSRDAIVPLLGRTVFLTHGDAIGSSGGQGFLGPIGPIVRGTKKVEAQQARADRRPDLILHGHFHTSANPGNVLANGSVPGYSEYGNGLRASLEPPQQWLFLLQERWGLRERLEVRLEEPKPLPKPRVSVTAAMT